MRDRDGRREGERESVYVIYMLRMRLVREIHRTQCLFQMPFSNKHFLQKVAIDMLFRKCIANFDLLIF